MKNCARMKEAETSLYLRLSNFTVLYDSGTQPGPTVVQMLFSGLVKLKSWFIIF